MKIYIQNLGMIVTNRCNLNCNHCMRCGSSNLDMSTDVIKATLDQVCAIGNLSLGGGEVTLAVPIIEEIFKYCIDNRILLEQVSTTINGTNYSPEFLETLDMINEYISYFSRKPNVTFTISYDKYHMEELKKRELIEKWKINVLKYQQSKYYLSFQSLSGKVFREGNAEKLPIEETIDLRPMQSLITYVGKRKKLDIKNGLCNIGPIITVNTQGIITECDASPIHQETLYNYGNVLTDSIEEVYKQKSLVLKPKKWFKETGKLMKEYISYEK